MDRKSLLSQIIPVLCSPCLQPKHPKLKGTMFLALKSNTGAHADPENMLRQRCKRFWGFFISQSQPPSPLRHKLKQLSTVSFSYFFHLVHSVSLFARMLTHSSTHTHTHTQSHLWWGGVLYFINSRLHAKIHYANLLFSRTQACQLTCGTNFSNPASPSPHPSSLTLSPTPANKYV